MCKQKRAVIVNDLSGIGKCSLSVAIPLLSVLNIEVCALPTAVLSNQTAFDKFSFLDLSDNMKSAIEVWKETNEHFDGIYTGFLGSKEQIELIKDLVKFNDKTLFIVDPVMGDNGAIYDTYTKELCDSIKELVSMADIITPNITEANILLNKNLDEFDISNVTIEEAKSMAKSLSSLGPRYVIITGVIIDDEILNVLYIKESDEFYIEKYHYNNYSYSGTGDIFASLITGYFLRGYDIKLALKKASIFIKKAIDKTIPTLRDPRYGVQFESILKEVLLDE